MTVKKTAISIFLLLRITATFGQYQKANDETDSTSIRSIFRNGKTEGHFRYFFMATDNKKGLTDYYANAIGGGLKFETGKFHGLQLGISGFFIFNVGSSDLTKPDPTTKQVNRYEIGLFDIENPSNKDDLDRLEELYLKYQIKKTTITIGKQLITTPFINLQDGRMRPTGVEGIWSHSVIGNTSIETGVLWRMSPRSTVKWFNIGHSIGVYTQGINESGQSSNYKDQLESKAIFLAGVTHQFNSGLKIQAWEQLTDNIFNSFMLQLDQSWKQNKSNDWYTGLQTILQHAINRGGNADPSKTYFPKGGQAVTMGARIGWKNKEHDISINYNRITSHGRYLMPREWGRDPFFTFLPRERNEGFGDSHAWMIKLKQAFPKARLQTLVGFGYYQLPDVTNSKLNKYGLPSYTQLNIDIQYQFSGLLKGAQAQFLYVHKGQIGQSYGNDKFVIHKLNTSLFNVILNYTF